MACFSILVTVFLKVLNQEPPLFVPKTAKKRPQIFFSKPPQFWSKAPQFETFSICTKLKMTHHAIFIAFLCDNFSQSNSKLQKNSKSNTFARFYLPSGLKSTRPKKFLAPQGSPKPPLWLQTATFRNTAGEPETCWSVEFIFFV